LGDSLRGGSFRAVLSLPQAHGITPGTPLTYRGVVVGKVLNLTPKPQGVAVEVKIWPKDRLIPSQSAIKPLEFKGKTVLDITPLTDLPASGVQAKPLDADCNPKLIICSAERAPNRSVSFGSLLRSVALLPEMNDNVQSIDEEVKEINASLQGIDKLSQEANKLLGTVNKNQTPAKIDAALVSAERAARDLSRAADKISRLSDTANSLLGEVQQTGTVARVNSTLTSVGEAAERLDLLLAVNQSNLTNTLTGIGQTSQELTETLRRLNAIARQIEDEKWLSKLDLNQLLKDLTIISANTAEISNKLLDFSTKLDDPQTSLKLQQILDSARTMFENLNKITSDLDELTGNPKLREEIRRLIEGLSNLLSLTQLLQGQITYADYLAQIRNSLKYSLPPPSQPTPQLAAKKPAPVPRLLPVKPINSQPKKEGNRNQSPPTEK
jgi:phospholipid/cholesterol/gamma-HCH transport system substrate-binding protein